MLGLVPRPHEALFVVVVPLVNWNMGLVPDEIVIAVGVPMVLLLLCRWLLLCRNLRLK